MPAYLPLNREEIRQRIRVSAPLSLTTTATKLFSSDVTTGLVRHIVAIILIGDGTASRTITVVYSGAGTGARTATILPSVPVGPTETKWFPPGEYDIEAVLTTLMGGENISASQNAGSGGQFLVVYWDSDVT